jgi:carbohydrate-binding DOMON domain-containing protein
MLLFIDIEREIRESNHWEMLYSFSNQFYEIYLDFPVSKTDDIVYLGKKKESATELISTNHSWALTVRFFHKNVPQSISLKDTDEW